MASAVCWVVTAFVVSLLHASVMAKKAATEDDDDRMMTIPLPDDAAGVAAECGLGQEASTAARAVEIC